MHIRSDWAGLVANVVLCANDAPCVEFKETSPSTDEHRYFVGVQENQILTVQFFFTSRQREVTVEVIVDGVFRKALLYKDDPRIIEQHLVVTDFVKDVWWGGNDGQSLYRVPMKVVPIHRLAATTAALPQPGLIELHISVPKEIGNRRARRKRVRTFAEDGQCEAHKSGVRFKNNPPMRATYMIELDQGVECAPEEAKEARKTLRRATASRKLKFCFYCRDYNALINTPGFTPVMPGPPGIPLPECMEE